MSQLILPRRFYSQPQGAVELSPQFAGNAEVAFLGHTVYNLAQGGPRLYLAGNTEFSVGSAGATIGPTGTGTGSVQFLNNSRTAGLISSGVIVAEYPTLVNSACLYNNCWDYLTNTADTGLGINVASTGKIEFNLQDVAVIVASSNGDFVAGKPNVVSWSYNGTSGLVILIVNGKYYTATSARAVDTVRTIGAFGDYYNAGTVGVVKKKFYLGAVWSKEKSLGELLHICRNPWGIFSAKPRVLYFDVGGGGSSTSLTVQDAAHAHAADAPVLTTEWLLAIADAASAHLADAPSLSTASVLAVAEALHAHVADSLTLGVTGSASLTVADAQHAHAADGLALTTDSLLAVADALHAHAADNLTLDTSNATALTIAEALHAHAADAPTFTTDAWLAVADAVHGHLADGVVLTTAETLAILEAVHAHSADNLTLWFGASYFERIDLRSLITFALALQSPITRRVDLESPLQ